MSEHAILRSAGAIALRFVPLEDADKLLAQMLLADSDPEVRQAALGAIGYRRLDGYAKVLLHVLQRDEHPATRGQVIALAAKSPALRPLLEWAAKNEPDPELRKQASQHLS